MDNETLKWVKKAQILGQILTNYRKEKQALIAKDYFYVFEILQDRKKYVNALKEINASPSKTPLAILQKRNIDNLVRLIQIERKITQNLFPKT